MSDTTDRWMMTRREMLGASAAALMLPLLEARPLAALTRFNFAARVFSPAEFALGTNPRLIASYEQPDLRLVEPWGRGGSAVGE